MIRQLARDLAEDIYRETLKGVFGLIAARIEWRRANAHQLALEAERMVYLLATDRGFVALRRARVNHWRRVQRKHSARAWAQDHVLASALMYPPGTEEHQRVAAGLHARKVSA